MIKMPTLLLIFPLLILVESCRPSVNAPVNICDNQAAKRAGLGPIDFPSEKLNQRISRINKLLMENGYACQLHIAYSQSTNNLGSEQIGELKTRNASLLFLLADICGRRKFSYRFSDGGIEFYVPSEDDHKKIRKISLDDPFTAPS